MSILYVLIPLSLALVALACWGFFWAVGAGQFDDLDSPAWEMLRDEDTPALPDRRAHGAGEDIHPNDQHGDDRSKDQHRNAAPR